MILNTISSNAKIMKINDEITKDLFIRYLLNIFIMK